LKIFFLQVQEFYFEIKKKLGQKCKGFLICSSWNLCFRFFGLARVDACGDLNPKSS
jgi:hypothetical protein